MAHPQQQEYCLKVKALFPEYFNNVRVCDIGSLNINGDNHYLFENYTYIGVDIGKGKNVNIISKGHEYKPVDGEKYDTVITTECLEHDKFWMETLQNITRNLVRSGGLFIMTCATTGRIEHGTKNTSPHFHQKKNPSYDGFFCYQFKCLFFNLVINPFLPDLIYLLIYLI
jgi:hypothetical protein